MVSHNLHNKYYLNIFSFPYGGRLGWGLVLYFDKLRGLCRPCTPIWINMFIFSLWHSISLTAKKWRKETPRPASRSLNNITVRLMARKLTIFLSLRIHCTIPLPFKQYEPLLLSYRYYWLSR